MSYTSKIRLAQGRADGHTLSQLGQGGACKIRYIYIGEGKFDMNAAVSEELLKGS